MAVPTRITDFSATAASNAPTGSESVGTSLDDYLRGYQSVVRLDLASKGADIASAGTTDLGAVGGLSHDITGTTTITGFGTVSAGVWKILKFEGALTLTHNATSLILPGGANITTAIGDIGIFASEGSGNWRCVSYQKATGKAVIETLTDTDGAYKSVQVYTSTDTWTKPAGLARVKVTVLGGGGAGGGATTTTAGEASVGAGGGAGGISIMTIEVGDLGATETATVGAGGTGVSQTTGNTGGTSSFGSHCSATGGVGGTTAGASGGANGVVGGVGGAGADGDININGAPGGIGHLTADAIAFGGVGGSSPYGRGGVGVVVAVGSDGTAAAVYGSGGSGAGNGSSQGSARTGGAGSAGLVIVEEFF